MLLGALVNANVYEHPCFASSCFCRVQAVLQKDRVFLLYFFPAWLLFETAVRSARLDPLRASVVSVRCFWNESLALLFSSWSRPWDHLCTEENAAYFATASI